MIIPGIDLRLPADPSVDETVLSASSGPMVASQGSSLPEAHASPLSHSQ